MSNTGASATTGASQLGRYRLTREIARSNDIVWEGLDPQVNRRLAVKELALDPTLTGQARRQRIERFYREARAAGAMNHPNIVTIYEVGEDRGRYFIAMEFLDGQTLRERLAVGGAFPVDESVRVVAALCDALDYAHRSGVIHRDIKPDNIFLLRPDNRVKLADFGIARITHEVQLTVAGQIFGTPSYMSPEQVLGKDIDARSDIFALGIVLYEMVTGRKPFVGDSVVTITYQIMNAPMPAVLGASPLLDSVIQRATAKNPADRYATAAEFKAALLAAAAAPRTGATMMPNANMAPPPMPMGQAPMATSAYSQLTQQQLGGAVGGGPLPTGGVGTAPPYPMTPNGGVTGFPPPPPLIEVEPRRNLGSTVAAIGVVALLVLGAGWAFTAALGNSKGGSGQSATTDYNKAAELYQKGQYESAARLFRKIGDAEKEAWCYRALGAKAMESKDFNKAYEWFALAASVNPGDTDAARGKDQARSAQFGDQVAKTGSTDPADHQPTPPPIATRPTPNASPFAGLTTGDWQADLQRKANAAQNFLNQGNALYQQGNLTDACRAWNDARQAGPGTQPGVTAGQYYQQYCNGADISAFGNSATRR